MTGELKGVRDFSFYFYTMRRRKKETILWKAAVVTENDQRKKKIELKIAKKNFEVEILKIELKYPESNSASWKIWFRVE